MAGITAISGSGLSSGIPGVDPSRPLSIGFGASAQGGSVFGSTDLSTGLLPSSFRGNFFSIYEPDLAIAATVTQAGIKTPDPASLLNIQPSKAAPTPIPGFGQSSGTNPGDPPQPSQQPQPSDAASQAAARRVQLFGNLVDLHARIAYANGTGDSGAATTLQQSAVQVNGQLQNQIFAGLGTSPIQPFASPEIPRIYFNTAA